MSNESVWLKEAQATLDEAAVTKAWDLADAVARTHGNDPLETFLSAVAAQALVRATAENKPWSFVAPKGVWAVAPGGQRGGLTITFTPTR